MENGHISMHICDIFVFGQGRKKHDFESLLEVLESTAAYMKEVVKNLL